MTTRPSQPGVTLRRATPRDADGIAAVHHQSHRETYGPIFDPHYTAPSRSEREAQWQQWLLKSDLAFVAVAPDDDVVGFIHATEDDTAATGAQHALITTLYLLRAWQHRGIGGALLNLMLDLLHGRGHEEARFGVLPTNVEAIRFYEAQGARQLGRVISHPGGDPHEDVLFAIATKSS